MSMARLHTPTTLFAAALTTLPHSTSFMYQNGESGGLGNSVAMDDVAAYDYAVPEPTTIVVWGLLGVVAAGYGVVAASGGLRDEPETSNPSQTKGHPEARVALFVFTCRPPLMRAIHPPLSARNGRNCRATPLPKATVHKAAIVEAASRRFMPNAQAENHPDNAARTPRPLLARERLPRKRAAMNRRTPESRMVSERLQSSR